MAEVGRVPPCQCDKMSASGVDVISLDLQQWQKTIEIFVISGSTPCWDSQTQTAFSAFQKQSNSPNLLHNHQTGNLKHWNGCKKD